MRLGLFGGRFDPPHIGHLLAAQQALEMLSLDRVHFVPAKTPPHKPAQIGGEMRAEMILLATAGHPQFTLDRRELTRSGPSYTFDTVSEVQDDYPYAELFFITGIDAYREIASWHRAEELVHKVVMVAVNRPGYNLDLLEPPFNERVRVLHTVACGVSSTDIRQRLANHQPIRYRVPELVESYLGKHNLYRQ